MLIVQGLVLMVAGAGIVFLFLGLLVAVLTVSAKVVPRFNHILPDGQPRAREHRLKGSGEKTTKHVVSPDEEIAVAVAAVMAHQRNV